MSASEVLRNAAAIVGAGWSPDEHARNALGEAVQLFGGTTGDTARAGVNPDATAFSLYGAIVKALQSGGADARVVWDVMLRQITRSGYVPGGTNHLHPVIGWNNAEGRTQDEVVWLLKQAADAIDAPHALPGSEVSADRVGPSPFRSVGEQDA